VYIFTTDLSISCVKIVEKEIRFFLFDINESPVPPGIPPPVKSFNMDQEALDRKNMEVGFADS